MRAPLVLVVAGGLFAADFSPTEYLGYVKFLAAPEMRGRASGSPELEKAASFIRDRFRSMNLKPLVADSFYQDFEVTASARLGTQNKISYSSGRHKTKLKIQKDFVPLNLSSAGHISGEVVFAGSGITAPEYNYVDYPGVDARAKTGPVRGH